MKTKRASISIPAKLSPPEPVRVLERARLFQRLDELRVRKLVWISGPPGAGKTTLVSTYLQARKLRGVWYQLDTSDADLATFFHYLGLAVKAAIPGHRTPLPKFTPEYLPGLQTFSRRFFELVIRWLGKPAVIVLDNYQDVAAEALIDTVLREACGVLPTGFALIVISRTDPPAGLARLQAHGECATVGWRELSFTPEEAFALAELRDSRTGVCRDRISAWHAETQGWAAGLVVMMEQGRQSGVAVSGFGETAQGVLFDYFAGEVFEKADTISQDILLKTAIVSHITESMATALTGTPHADRVLDQLYRRNYFVTRRTESAAVYEYHPLFRRFLLNRAQATLPEAVRTALLNRAGELLADTGRYDEAAALYQQAENWEALGQLTLREAQTLIAQGRNTTLSRWLAWLPGSAIENDPWLLYWRGMAFLPFDPVAARRDLECAFDRFERRDDPSGRYLSWAGVAQSYQVEWASLQPMSQWIERLETCLARFPFPSLEIEALVIGSMPPVLLHRPEHPLCRRFAERAWALLTQPIDPSQAVPLANTALFYRVITGECAWAMQIVDSLSPRIMEARVSPLAMITWRTVEAICGWHTGDHDLAFRAVDEALSLSRESGVHLLDLSIYAQGVYAALSGGDTDRAERFLAPMRPLLDPRRPMDLCHYELLKGLAITRGEGAQALAAARRNLESSQALGNAMGGEVVGRLSLALILIELGEHAEARGEIAKMRRFAAKMRSHWLAFNALMAEANSHFLTGEEHEGLARLREALTLGRIHGFSNCHPWWLPKVMARLCAKALQAGIEVGYVRHLIKHRALTPDSLDNKHWPWSIKVYALGHFEILIDDTPIPATERKRPKPLELLRVLIALGGRQIPVGEVADLLWPDADGDAGYRALITNLNRLRALLHDKDAIEITGTCLSINLEHVWVDTWAFESLLAQAAQATKGGDSARASTLREQALELYRGPFLDAASGGWAIPRRDRLRALYVQHLDAAARELEAAGQLDDALSLYQRGNATDDLAEVFYQGLIRCLQELGRAGDARAVYDRSSTIHLVAYLDGNRV